MIELRRITTASDQALDSLFSIYNESFPPEERRQPEALLHLIENESRMLVNVIESSDDFCGLFIYWDFDEFYYLEHFAVDPTKRNQKIGQQVLDYFRTKLRKPHVLEVEPASDEMTTRRINYYQRNGYEILSKTYEQPSYHPIGAKGIPMWLMGHPEAAKQIDRFAAIIRKEVYGAE